MSGFDHNIKAYSTSDISKPTKVWQVTRKEIIPRDRSTRAQKPTVQYVLSDGLNDTQPLQKAEVAASAPLPPSDSENRDSSSSTEEQIDELTKLSPKSPQNVGERKESSGPPPYSVRGLPVTPTSTEFESPDTEIIVRGATGVTVPDTLLHFANYLTNRQQVPGGTTTSANHLNALVVIDIDGAGTGQVINAVDGVNETDEELQESVVEEDNTSDDSETDEMAKSNWSPRHFSGTAIEDADV